MTNERLEELAREVAALEQEVLRKPLAAEAWWDGEIQELKHQCKQLAHAVLQYLGKEEE